MSNTIHIIGAPHTIVSKDFSLCALTSKVFLLPGAIVPFGWYVIEYSNEGSESSAHEHVALLSSERFLELTRRTSRDVEPEIGINNSKLEQEYKIHLIKELRARVRPGDIVCHIWCPDLEVYDAIKGCQHVDLSPGYRASSGLPFRIFESSAWMHYSYGKNGVSHGSNYNWVVPPIFDEEAWIPGKTKNDYVLYCGDVAEDCGLNVLIEIAKRMPELEFCVCGPGNPSPWFSDKPRNVHFEGQVFGESRIQKVQGARCVLTPTMQIESFGRSGVEAQLCGVPQVSSCIGSFQETIIEGVTGFQCHTLADWVAAIKKCELLDRDVIAKSARERYSKSSVGRTYNWAFRQLADLSTEGWYGGHTRKYDSSNGTDTNHVIAKIWLFIPFFGSLPIYFDLYLESLRRNSGYINVVMLTDIDLTGYSLPQNFTPIPMTLPGLRTKISNFMHSELGIALDKDRIIDNPYKLVDFKIIYPDLFRGIGQWLGIAPNDYVGWGDVDVIYGLFRNFMELEKNCEVIGGFHGHFTAFRNSGYARNAYKDIPNLAELLLSKNSELTDEMVLRGPLLRSLSDRGGKMFYINRYFCDVVPACFVSRFRSEEPHPESCFFDAYHPDLNIREVRCLPDGRLVAVHDDKSTREIIYCHLQKREMKRNAERAALDFIIRRDGFYDA